MHARSTDGLHMHACMGLPMPTAQPITTSARQAGRPARLAGERSSKQAKSNFGMTH